LCRPDSGRILIAGLALDDIARLDRVRWLAWKAQDPALFAGTLEPTCASPAALPMHAGSPRPCGPPGWKKSSKAGA
jgi:hypothetical protein